MRHIKTEVEIKASAAAVWSILSNLECYATWNPLIRQASGNVQERGQVQLFICTPGLASRKVSVALLKVDPPRELRWLGRLFMPYLLDGDHSFVISPLGPDRVRVIQQESFSGALVPFVAPWLLPNMKRGFEAMNLALKERAEAGSTG